MSESDLVARHHFEEHTGEVRLCVEASTLTAVFEEAARALAELMLEGNGAPADESLQKIELRASDRDLLLVDFLNELIFLSETRKHVYTDVRVERASDTELHAIARGVVPSAIRTAAKAATLHGVRFEQRPGGFFASVILDV